METSTSNRLLRFGIMCDGTAFQAWQARCIRALLDMEDVEPALLIINAEPTRFPWMERLKRARPRQMLFQLYKNVIARTPAARREDLSQELAGLPSIRCVPIRKGKFSRYLSESDRKAIQAFDLDFVLRFSFGIIRGEALKVARYGVWSFHHGDEQRYRGGPAGLWEIYDGDNVTGAILQKLTDRLDGGVVLKKGYLKTIHESWARSISTVMMESAKWPAQVCRDIHNGVADYLDAPPSSTSAPIRKAPGNLQMLIFLGKLLRNLVRRGYVGLFQEHQWNIGIVNQPVSAFLEPGVQPHVQWLPAPERHQYRADPFAIARGSKLYLFYEAFDSRANQGRIACMEITDGVPGPELQVEIGPTSHMSYPYLFEHEGEVYCIPETSQAKEVALYRATQFPLRWTKRATLIPDFAGADSTVFFHDGRWWLTCTNVANGANRNLLIWHAPHLFGPWEPHAGNPVKTDIRSARPAGTPFLHQGQLFRPAQDCSRSYGGSLVINRVLELTPTRFREEVTTVMEPFAGSLYGDGIHTLSSVGNITLLDSNRLTFDRYSFKHGLSRRLLSMRGSFVSMPGA